MPTKGDIQSIGLLGWFISDIDYPSENDVEDGVSFGDGSFEGNLELPTQIQVEAGVGFGSNGTEFTGTLETTTLSGNIDVTLAGRLIVEVA